MTWKTGGSIKLPRRFLLPCSSYSEGNSLDRISLPIFASSSFLCFKVCHKAGSRNISYICLNKCWSSPSWSEIRKCKNNKCYNIYISIFTQLHGLRNTCFVYPMTPLHPFLYCSFVTGGTRQKAAMSECFWSHMWPSFSLELGLAMCVVCVLRTGLRVCVVSILTYLTFTHKMLSILSHDQTKHISFNKHENQTLFWFMGRSHT